MEFGSVVVGKDILKLRTHLTSITISVILDIDRVWGLILSNDRVCLTACFTTRENDRIYNKILINDDG